MHSATGPPLSGMAIKLTLSIGSPTHPSATTSWLTSSPTTDTRIVAIVLIRTPSSTHKPTPRGLSLCQDLGHTITINRRQPKNLPHFPIRWLPSCRTLLLSTKTYWDLGNTRRLSQYQKMGTTSSPNTVVRAAGKLVGLRESPSMTRPSRLDLANVH